ncbi:flocculation protein FLO11-like isoform X1 [Vespa mandarinia]|uniref:flocculation protein FLO11-like isoform X1 n=1 Tax=Vespa mandarinia TaxID=7446 RepID=UPI00161D3B50|nr:flocculation protein FLO11-like isoform X1 [Vespa mandarinia]
MDIRIYALLLLFVFVGSNAEFRPSARHRRDVERKSGEYYSIAKIIKRAVDSSTTTTKKSSEDSTSTNNKNPGTTTPNTASPDTTTSNTASPDTTTSNTASSGTVNPSTKSPTTTKATPSTPKPTPKPTSGTTKATTTKSNPTSTETTTKPITEATSKPQLGLRSAFEEKDDSPSKPSNSDEKPEKKPSSVSSRIKPDTPDKKDKSPSSPSMLNSGYPSTGGNYPFPGFNSIPPYGPNYAFTSTNSSPGGSASASASSFASAGASSGHRIYPAYDSPSGFYPNNPFYNPNEYTPGNKWPINDIPQNNPIKPITSSRSSFDTEDKPKSSNNSPIGNNAHPISNPNSIPSIGPQNFPNPFYGGPYTPNFDYPAVNSVQGPNYAWTNSGPGYAGASAGASSGTGLSFGSRGAFPDNNAGAGYMDNSAYIPGNIDPGFGFPQSGFDPDFGNNFAAHQRMMEEHFKAIQAQIEAQQRAIFEASNGLNTGPGSSDPGLQSAISSISVGPRGGFQAAQINPAAPGIESRFANELPPPSGGQYGVFASSHSSSATDETGRTIGHKSATTGVNDNGKITFRTIQDK